MVAFASQFCDLRWHERVAWLSCPPHDPEMFTLPGSVRPVPTAGRTRTVGVSPPARGWLLLESWAMRSRGARVMAPRGQSKQDSGPACSQERGGDCVSGGRWDSGCPERCPGKGRVPRQAQGPTVPLLERSVVWSRAGIPPSPRASQGGAEEGSRAPGTRGLPTLRSLLGWRLGPPAKFRSRAGRLVPRAGESAPTALRSPGACWEFRST